MNLFHLLLSYKLSISKVCNPFQRFDNQLPKFGIQLRNPLFQNILAVFAFINVHHKIDFCKSV